MNEEIEINSREDLLLSKTKLEKDTKPEIGKDTKPENPIDISVKEKKKRIISNETREKYRQNMMLLRARKALQKQEKQDKQEINNQATNNQETDSQFLNSNIATRENNEIQLKILNPTRRKQVISEETRKARSENMKNVRQIKMENSKKRKDEIERLNKIYENELEQKILKKADDIKKRIMKAEINKLKLDTIDKDIHTEVKKQQSQQNQQQQQYQQLPGNYEVNSGAPEKNKNSFLGRPQQRVKRIIVGD